MQTAKVTKRLETSAKHAVFQDVTAELGVDASLFHDNWNSKQRPRFQTGGIYCCDYNRDGCTDLLVTCETLRTGHILYEGQPDGTLVDVTADLNLPTEPFGLATWADLDGDGWEDLVLGRGRVFRNQQGRAFQEIPNFVTNLAQVGRFEQTQDQTGVVVADYDRDGDIDLYLSRGNVGYADGSWVRGKSNDVHRNQLLRNDGNWRFTDVTEETGTDGGGRSVFSSVWLDANNDLWPDLYVIHEYGNGILLINRQGSTFESREIQNVPSDFGSMGVTSGDFNNDGKMDIYVASMYSKSGSRVIGNLREDAYPQQIMRELRRMVAGSQLYQGVGASKFKPVGPRMDVCDVGWAYGPTMADLNNDGWLDIFAPTGFISRDRSKPDG